MANFFTDRSVEHPGRYRLNPTDDASIYDLVRAEGAVYQAGTPLNAEHLNDAMQNVIDQIPDAEMFIAQEGTTTYAQVTAAVTAGLAVFATKANGSLFDLYQYAYTESNVHYFTRSGGTATAPKFESLTLSSSNTWATASNELVPNVVTMATPTISVTAGSLVSAAMARCGKIRSLNIAVKNSSATPVGSNVFQGSLSVASDRPATLVNAAGYYGSSAAVLQIAASGSIVVRIIGAQLEANGTVYCGCSYLVP